MKKIIDIDWSVWIPEQRATLLFVIRNNQILLIHKKRGLGAGKINGPGGRIEAGETALEGAVREVEEELCVTPQEVSFCGELSFQFVDGLSLHCSVFRAENCTGTPQETDEAIPLWVPIDKIPYDNMWQDDQYWMPLMFDSKVFNGKFIFDKDTMLDKVIEQIPPAP